MGSRWYHDSVSSIQIVVWQISKQNESFIEKDLQTYFQKAESHNAPGSQISDVLLYDEDEAVLNQQLRDGKLWGQDHVGVHEEGGEHQEAHRAHVHQQRRQYLQNQPNKNGDRHRSNQRNSGLGQSGHP